MTSKKTKKPQPQPQPQGAINFDIMPDEELAGLAAIALMILIQDRQRHDLARILVPKDAAASEFYSFRVLGAGLHGDMCSVFGEMQTNGDVRMSEIAPFHNQKIH